MSDEMTVGEVARLFATLTVTVDRIEQKLDGLNEHYVPREIYRLEMDPQREGSLMARVRNLEERVADTFSKKSLYAILTVVAALAVGVGAIVGVLKP